MYEAATKLRLPRGLVPPLAAEFRCSERSLQRLWKSAREKIQAGTIHDGESGRRGRSGRKQRLNDEFAADLAKTIALLPLHERTNLRTLEEHLGVSKKRLQPLLKNEPNSDPALYFGTRAAVARHRVH
jgi:hypothetical protein